MKRYKNIFRDRCSIPNCKKIIAMVRILYDFKCIMTHLEAAIFRFIALFNMPREARSRLLKPSFSNVYPLLPEHGSLEKTSFILIVPIWNV